MPAAATLIFFLLAEGKHWAKNDFLSSWSNLLGLCWGILRRFLVENNTYEDTLLIYIFLVVWCCADTFNKWGSRGRNMGWVKIVQRSRRSSPAKNKGLASGDRGSASENQAKTKKTFTRDTSPDQAKTRRRSRRPSQIRCKIHDGEGQAKTKEAFADEVNPSWAKTMQRPSKSSRMRRRRPVGGDRARIDDNFALKWKDFWFEISCDVERVKLSMLARL